MAPLLCAGACNSPLDLLVVQQQLIVLLLLLLLSLLLHSVGTINFTVQFMPFEEPQFDDDIELKPVKTGQHT
jgi:hypothetical protein